MGPPLPLGIWGRHLRSSKLRTRRGSSKVELKADTVKRVAWAWRDYDRDDWSGGFVLELADGQRVYVESDLTVPVGGLGRMSRFCVWRPIKTLPELAANHDSKLHGWMKDPPELNEYLGRLS